jgi:hypothetical protein
MADLLASSVPTDRKPNDLLAKPEEPSTLEKVGRFAGGAAVGAVTGLPEMAFEAGKGIAESVMHPVDVGYKKYVKPLIDLDIEFHKHPIETAKKGGEIFKEAAKKFAAEDPYEQGKAVGQFLSPGMYAKAVDLAIAKGVPMATATREMSARELEKRGIKIEPGQVAGIEPEPSAGFTRSNKNANQAVVNRWASEDTGRLAVGNQQINHQFLDERFNTLGKMYDRAYQGKNFKINDDTIGELRQMFREEKSLGPAGARAATGVAKTILDAHANLGGAGGTLEIQGEGLQRLRTELQTIGRTSQDAAERRQAWKVIGMLDDSIAEQNPKLAKALKIINKQYRATATLDNLQKSGGIQGGDVSADKLGAYLRHHPFHGTESQKELGYHGENTGLLARWERSPTTSLPTGGNLAVRIAKALNVSRRTQYARNIQRRLAAKLKANPNGIMSTGDSMEAESLLNQLDQEPVAPSPAAPPSTGPLPPPQGFGTGLPKLLP